MQILIRARSFRRLVAFWVLVNVVTYLGIEWMKAPAMPAARPISRQALALFAPSPSRLDETREPPQYVPAYRLMSPANPKSGDKYPLVVFLHGSGERDDDNRAQLRGFPEQMSEPAWRTQFPCFLLAPQCPEDASWSTHEEEVIDLIRTVMAKQPIDPQRVYLTGLSMGGFGCWELASSAPELFAAVVPICGGGDPSQASQIAQVPIWAVHGDADQSVPVQESREMIQALRAAGSNPIYSELQYVGHDSWTQSYRDPNGVVKWMFQQRKPAAHGK